MLRKVVAAPRSIPACAGEASDAGRSSAIPPVYPRVCGGSIPDLGRGRQSEGLSPRVRGKLFRSIVPGDKPGSIPACAGEAIAPGRHQRDCQVYPRVCGGSTTSCTKPSSTGGLSPRVRGKPPTPPGQAGTPGSIPACAGEALPGKFRRRRRRVYPRVCGGSGGPSERDGRRPGLSPRVRGKLIAIPFTLPFVRSIPACAGEAPPMQTPNQCRRVYPRVCGGSVADGDGRAYALGLSPRVRGKRRHRKGVFVVARSIPACAGEADDQQPAGLFLAVYPRVCGGSGTFSLMSTLVTGLSPRVRGKPSASCTACYCSGSIPACAGEAQILQGVDDARRVYPRVCGGSAVGRGDNGCMHGLSPRVRGKPFPVGFAAYAAWSIPACAGEAGCRWTTSSMSRVYPRVCGGSRLVPGMRRSPEGLSPRVRGKPDQRNGD